MFVLETAKVETKRTNSPSLDSEPLWISKRMLSGLGRHFSVVSILLIVGAGLILLEGPVGSNYFHQLTAPKTEEAATSSKIDSQATADSAKPGTVDARVSTWANTMDDASPLHSTVLGEIPASDKIDPGTVSK
jgi:hypothetical protein